jgi:hypothetical protein
MSELWYISNAPDLHTLSALTIPSLETRGLTKYYTFTVTQLIKTTN